MEARRRGWDSLVIIFDAARSNALETASDRGAPIFYRSDVREKKQQSCSFFSFCLFFSPSFSSAWHRTECIESIVIFIQLLMHGAPARSLPVMLLHWEAGGRWTERGAVDSIGMLMISGTRITGGRLEDKKHERHVNEKFSMKEIIISCAIYQEKMYANGDIPPPPRLFLSHWISKHFAALQMHRGA